MRLTGRCLVASAVLALAWSTGAPVATAAPTAGEVVDCLAVTADDPRPSTDLASAPLAAMGVDRARAWLQRSGREAGAGVTVAVLSTGISRDAGLALGDGGTSVVGPGPVVDPTGTVVAGLVAGSARSEDLPVGIAPGAELVDVRVLDRMVPTSDGEEGPSARALAAGLSHVRDRLPRVDVVVVPLQVEPDARVREVVSDLVGSGVLVVAQAGDRPADTASPADRLSVLAEPRPGEDAGPLVTPASVEGVVAAGPVPEEARAPLVSTALDVVAPSAGAVSTSLVGGTCTVGEVRSAWSAAYVAGVLALLRSAHPDESPAQLVARLVGTADGRPDVRSPLTGAGQVRALAALTATPGQVADDLDAVFATDTALPPPAGAATAPVATADPLAAAREQAVWWGLLGGGVLLLALLLRPLVRRSG
ncbi:MAG: S8 family serine peptidase [Actinomycetota bacterium]|nr:S8 family serine peptidase [Actinomycetota bacterium]